MARPAAVPVRDFHGELPGSLQAGGFQAGIGRRPLCEIHETASTPSHTLDFGEDLVVRLGRMPIDLAAPLLRASLPTLTPQALLALIASTGEAHHRLIAARPALDWRVIKALLRTHNDTVVATLARNLALSFDDEDEAVFARRALENAEVRAALLHHPALNVAKAQLRLHRGNDESHNNLKLLVLLRGDGTAGFVQELARRLKFDTAALSRVLTATSPVPLALAVCAAGLDRAVFLHILSKWQTSCAGEPALNAGQRPLVLPIFDLTPVAARRKLAALMNGAH